MKSWQADEMVEWTCDIRTVGGKKVLNPIGKNEQYIVKSCYYQIVLLSIQEGMIKYIYSSTCAFAGIR